MAKKPKDPNKAQSERAAKRGIMARLWEHKFLIISFLAGLVLILGSLLYRTGLDLEASHFATRRLTGTEPPLEVLYRQRLYFDPPGDLGAPLIVRLPDAFIKTVSNPAPTPVALSVLFVSDNLIFTDADGNPVPPQIFISNETAAQTVGTLYMRPKPLRVGAPTTATLGMVAPPYTLGKPLELTRNEITQQPEPIELETEWDARVRNFLGHLFGQNAWLLAAGVAAIGWGLDWFLRRLEHAEEERQEERRRRLQPIREMMVNDPANGLREFLVLEQAAKEEKWADSLQTAVGSFRAEFAKKTEVKRQVVQQAGEAVAAGNRLECNDILTTFDNFFYHKVALLPDAAKTHLKTLREGLDTAARKDETFPERAQEAALWLLHEFDNYARGLIRELLNGVYSVPQPQTLLDKLDNAPKGKRLARDAEIRQTLANGGLKSRYWDYNYDWSPKFVAAEFEEPEARRLWHRQAHLQGNPFGYGSPARDPNLLRVWVNPVCWRTIQDNRSMVLYAADGRNSHAVAVRLYRRVFEQEKESELKAVFPVWFLLPVEEMPPNSTHTLYLEQIARAYSKSWCDLLANEVDTFLELNAAERMTVAELLFWSSGGDGYVISRLRQAGLPDDVSGHYLRDLLARTIETSRCGEHPDEDQLRAWLSIRPSRLDSTFLIVSCKSILHSQAMRAYAEQLLQMADIFAQCGVTLKLFTTTRFGGSMEEHALEWEPDALAKNLNHRVNFATEPLFRSGSYGTGMRFSDLFNQDFGSPEQSLNAEEMVADAAKGSLYRALDIANAVVQSRLGRTLSKEDVELERVLLDPIDLKNGMVQFLM